MEMNLPTGPGTNDPGEFGLLLQEARAGSRSALGRLLEVYRPYLHSIANQELGPELKAKLGGSDLVQQSFLEAYQCFADFAGDREEDWKQWLTQILRNNLHDAQRSFRGTQKRSIGREAAFPEGLAEVMPGSSLSPGGMLLRQEKLESIQRALDQLDEKTREIIRLRQQEAWTFAQIGAQFQMSAEAARKCWARAIEELRVLLGGSDAGSS